MNQMVKRIIMSVLGVVICGISVGMFKFAALGIDPFQSLMSGLDAVIPIRFGTLYIIVNVVLLLFALIFDRKKIGIATFINLFLLGYIVEFSQGLCERLMPDAPLWLRVVILLIAIVILCLSSALYFTADLGVSTYDAVALVCSSGRKSRASSGLPFAASSATLCAWRSAWRCCCSRVRASPRSSARSASAPSSPRSLWDR